MPVPNLNSCVPKVLFVSFQWPTVADYSLFYSSAVILPPSLYRWADGMTRTNIMLGLMGPKADTTPWLGVATPRTPHMVQTL